MIPFNAKMTGKSDIKNYADYLVENAGGAVLSWITEGARKAIANDYILTAPKAVEDAIGKYRQNNDWLSEFLDECCEVSPSFSEKAGDLYQEYRNFAPKAVEDAIGKYRQNNDWLSEFLDECCEVSPSFSEKAGDLYQEYRNFCARTGEFCRRNSDFYSSLENAGFLRKRRNIGVIVNGLKLKSDFLEEN